MPKRRRTNVHTYDFDASFTAEVESDDYDDDIFDTKEQKGGSGTDATDIDDLCDDDLDYWRRKVEAFNEDPCACQDYSPGTTVLLDAMEEQWRQYVLAKETRNQEEELFGHILEGREQCLIEQRRANRCMTIDDLKQRVETMLNTTKKSLKLGELRILAVLFVLLLAPAGSRPEGGPHKLPFALLRSSPKAILVSRNSKSIQSAASKPSLHYRKTYSIPETMFNPFLLLSPHVFLLDALFRHRAFNASSLTSPHHLDNLDIHPGERELPLPSREDLNDIFTFRRAIETFTGYQIFTNDCLTSGMMAAWIQRIGEILGFEYPTIAYNLRYNAANAFDQSVEVSEALRNLALGHGNSDPFQRHFLGRNISADLWGVLWGHKPPQALMKQSCSIGHSISERRPIGLTLAQSASVATHPTLRELTKALRELPQGSKQDEWTDKQATKDIERPAQRRLIEKLTTPIVTTLEGQYRRRDEAIEAVSAYCLVQEGCTLPLSRPRSTPKAAVCYSSSDPLEGGQLDFATRSIFITNDKERSKRFLVCFGQALDLPPDDEGQLDELTHEFYTSNDLTKHFRKKHLSKVADGDRPEYKVCRMTLDHKMHLQKTTP
ncbi:C2H2 finger domain-containing protein [Colletotrichum orchidophilum]|uniref:C2H2 finger domain-containing protein n=1 Tax=Colletotrichum orchidophilum TaxID=1209926 RepID=A0A1G4AMJ4_9PEZI|nr:C2H2 finger domain-containing protein [Colletotrichum orchidophilum]OHE90399.1 C2H2 finger domain-containing protein [Colletotrichum orchidophilum]